MYPGPNIVTNGLVLALDAANTKSYPGSGTTWRDLSGTSVTGSLVNGPTFNSADLGSIQFDGTNDYVNLGNIFNFTSQDFTFYYWVYFNTFTTTIGGQGPVIFFKGDYRVDGYYNQVFPDGSCNFVTSQPSADQITSTNIGTIVIQKWYNICCTRTESVVRIYVNGVDATLTSATHINPTSNNRDFTLAVYNKPGYLIYGNLRLSNFLTYNRTLSAREVLQNYNATKSRFNL